MPKVILDIPNPAVAKKMKERLQEETPDWVDVQIVDPVTPDDDEDTRYIKHQKIRNKVLKVIKKSGVTGIISDEVLDELPGYPYASVTCRYHELIDANMIFRQGKRPGRSGANQSIMFAYRPYVEEDANAV